MSLLSSHLQIYVKTTATCNLNCHHCFTSGSRGPKIFFNPKKTAHFIQRLVETYSTESLRLLYHGGEPLLAPVEDLLNFYELTKNIPTKVEYGLQTNLVYTLTKDKLNFFEKVFQGYGLGTSWDLDIRFGSLNPKIQVQQLKLWEDNVRKLASLGYEMTLMVCLTKMVVEKYTARQVIDYAADLGFKYILFERMTLDGNAQDHQDQLRPLNKDLDAWMYQMYLDTVQFQLNKKIGNMFLDELALAAHQQVHVANRCRQCEQKLITINADGSLAGCPNSATEKTWSHIDQPISSFVSSEGRIGAVCKEKVRNTACFRCDLADVCNGDCYKLPWDGELCAAPKSLMRQLKQTDLQPLKELIL